MANPFIILSQALAQPPQPDYDMRGYVSKYGTPDQSKGQHLTDEFKLPNHITFSNQSMYHSDETPGGVWDRHPTSNQWQYTPSPYVIQQHGIPKLQKYFQEQEPNSILNLP